MRLKPHFGRPDRCLSTRYTIQDSWAFVNRFLTCLLAAEADLARFALTRLACVRYTQPIRVDRLLPIDSVEYRLVGSCKRVGLHDCGADIRGLPGYPQNSYGR
jgi:hypothetical protein